MQTEVKRVYVADDDDNIRQLVKTFLSSDGYQVEDFPTGDLLLERFRRERCDLVILDVMMPGSDGFTVCTELRKLSTVPIIMLTARDSENDFAMGLGLGSDDYITKPFSAMALLLRVRAIFRRVDFESQKHAARVGALFAVTLALSTLLKLMIEIGRYLLKILFAFKTTQGKHFSANQSLCLIL